jgi:hypothetical protein
MEYTYCIMKKWYSVSLVGWIVTGVHSVLTACVVWGLWRFDAQTQEIEFFRGATYMYMVLVTVLLYAWHKNIQLFHAKH